jgi:hypothetical protein
MSNGNQAKKVILRPAPPPLPATVEDLEKDRVFANERTLNDYVEEAFLDLYKDDKKFRAFLYAVYDEQAVEGSLAIDNAEAATMIRDWGAQREVEQITREKKATIVKAMNVVLRRFGKSRKDRKNMIHGEIVQHENDDN